MYVGYVDTYMGVSKAHGSSNTPQVAGLLLQRHQEDPHLLKQPYYMFEYVCVYVYIYIYTVYSGLEVMSV